MFSRMWKSLLLLMLITSPLAAQYIPPGSTRSPVELPYPEQEVRTGLDEAAWRLGALRLSPWLGLSDLSLVSQRNELREEETDVTATAGAGIRAYVKNGRKVIWTAHVLPEYVFWKDDKSKESLNGRYGAGLFAYGNRLDMEVSWRRSEQQSFFSSEVQELTTRRDDISRFLFDLELTRRFSLVGGYSLKETGSQDEEASFALLDRDEEELALRLFVRTAGWSFAVGFEERTTDFAAEARNLSHEGEVGLFHLGYEGGRFGLRLEAERLSLAPRTGSAFAPLEATTGYLETFWELGQGGSLFLYANRRLDYSIESGVSNVLAERLGTRLNWKLFAAQLGFLLEAGDDEYRESTGVVSRIDDVHSYGTTLGFNLRSFGVRFRAVRSVYDSSFDIFDRDVVTWGFSIELGAVREFGLGTGDRLW